MEIVIEAGVWKGLWRERAFGGIQQQGAVEVGGYRSMGLETAVLDGELSCYTAAGSHRSGGLERAMLEGRAFVGAQRSALEDDGEGRMAHGRNGLLRNLTSPL